MQACSPGWFASACMPSSKPAARVALPAIPTMGLLTGLSYVSGVDYYKGINERVAAALGKGNTVSNNNIHTLTIKPLLLRCPVIRQW